jgi:ribosomal protein L34E
LELENEKEEYTINSIVKTPVFSKTQPKAEKTPSRTYGAIDTIKRQNLGVFRGSVIYNLRYQ